MSEYGAYVGLDVHKDATSVASAFPVPEQPVFRGVIGNRRSSLRRLIRNPTPLGEVLSFCYGAGPIRPVRGTIGITASRDAGLQIGQEDCRGALNLS